MPSRKLRHLAVLVALVSGPAAAQTTTEAAALAFTNVTVIDATGAAPRLNQTVLIRGNRIAELGATGRVAIPRGTRVVNARGKVLIPGLWDAHVHITTRLSRDAPSGLGAEVYLPMLVANGVTAVRDMSGDLEKLNAWRQAIRSGVLDGPRIFASGPKLADGKSASILAGRGSAAESARARVRELHGKGADFIKVGSELSAESYFAIVSEASRLGLPVVGHVPESVSASEASDAGQRTIEHLTGVLPECSADPAGLDALRGRPEGDSGMPEGASRAQALRDRLVETHDGVRAGRLFSRFVRNGTWHVPTLTGLAQQGFSLDTVPTAEAWARYTPLQLARQRERALDERRSRLFPRAVARARRFFGHQLEVVRAMRRAGVTILAGTDSPSPAGLPGFSLHGELELLVRAGLTPTEALQAATRDPARLLGVGDSLGTVERGKVADLVLLDANPIERISNTRLIAGVVLNGRYLARPELAAGLARLEARRQAERAGAGQPRGGAPGVGAGE